jgi:cysteine desulfurase / selenocysteine lyase
MISFPKVVGTDDHIKLKNGKDARVILLNNAATTPPFESTLKAVNEYLQTYGALHRGAGPHANITFQKADEAIKTLRKFLDCTDDQALLFTSNTSSAINLFIRMLRLKENDVIIKSVIEHTSNNLPWSFNSDAKTVYVNAFDDGSLDYDDLEKKVLENADNLKLIAITGASNLTGYIPDIERISKLAHKHNALLFIDAAQLAPHRPISMKNQNIDALAFSAHKVYAPFGLGILALPKKLLETKPVDPGGGSIDMVSEKHVVWASPESRHQTGTWNVTGIIAAAASCKMIMDTGWDKIIGHEKELVHYAAEQLQTVPDITLYVPAEKYLAEDRIGTFTFNLKGYHHALLSAILENEYGIETRAGTICNHRLVRRWFNIDDTKQKEIEEKIEGGDKLASYGIVRASLAIHNTKEDIDALVSALKSIVTNKHALKYKPVPIEEIYICEE